MSTQSAKRGTTNQSSHVSSTSKPKSGNLQNEVPHNKFMPVYLCNYRRSIFWTQLLANLSILPVIAQTCFLLVKHSAVLNVVIFNTHHQVCQGVFGSLFGISLLYGIYFVLKRTMINISYNETTNTFRGVFYTPYLVKEVTIDILITSCITLCIYFY